MYGLFCALLPCHCEVGAVLDDVELAEHEHRVAEHEAEPDGELVRVELDRLCGYIGKAAMKRKFKFVMFHEEAV